MDELERVFPFARRLEVAVPLSDDGSLIAELLLAVRDGETRVQLYRFPGPEEPALEDELRWPARMSVANGAWAWLVAWDGVASRDEIRELVAKRVIRHPALGDPSN